MSTHITSPNHKAGLLFDCPACEDECFCEELQADQVTDAEDTEPTICVHCAIEGEAQNARAQARFGRRTYVGDEELGLSVRWPGRN